MHPAAIGALPGIRDDNFFRPAENAEEGGNGAVVGWGIHPIG